MRELKRELWPYRIQLPTNETYDIEVWLGENMGALHGRWNVVYKYGHCDYYFRNGQDATLFSLRWSN